MKNLLIGLCVLIAGFLCVWLLLDFVMKYPLPCTLVTAALILLGVAYIVGDEIEDAWAASRYSRKG